MHLPLTRLATTTALVLLMNALPAMAQETPWLPFSTETTGVLEEGDLRAPLSDWNDDAYLHDDYLINATAGQRLLIQGVSDDFDIFLALYRDGEEGGGPVAFDDDGAGYPNALLRHTTEADGVYRLRVRGYNSESAGAYVLNLTERVVAPSGPPVRIAPRGETEGELAHGDSELEYGEYYDAYVFSARAGEAIHIRLNADDFDPILYVGRETGGEFEVIAVNDDGDDGLNSLIRFTAPEDGDYVIRAASLGSAQVGGYTLSLADAPPPPRLEAIRAGGSVSGELTEDAATDEDSFGYVAYAFTAAAGQRVAISLTSDDFDPYLVLGRTGASGFDIITQNDDGGEGLNSLIRHTFDTAGDYVIRARSFAGMGAGAFTLSVTEIEPDPEPEPLHFGQTAEGRITETSVSDGGLFNAYRFEGRAGQRVQIIMRSGDFDALVHLGREGDSFELLASDDDGLGEGLNSRLNHTLDADGAYVVRATSFGGQGLGLYSVELLDRGPKPASGSLLIGSTVRGALGERAELGEGGNYYDTYRFRAEAGDRLRIVMVSNAFDAFVVLGRETNGRFQAIVGDDDGLSDTNAKIDHVVTEGGWYAIRATSFGPNVTGPYALTVERRP